MQDSVSYYIEINNIVYSHPLVVESIAWILCNFTIRTDLRYKFARQINILSYFHISILKSM